MSVDGYTPNTPVFLVRNPGWAFQGGRSMPVFSIIVLLGFGVEWDRRNYSHRCEQRERPCRLYRSKDLWSEGGLEVELKKA